MKRLGLLTWLLLTVGYVLAAEVTEQKKRYDKPATAVIPVVVESALLAGTALAGPGANEMINPNITEEEIQ